MYAVFLSLIGSYWGPDDDPIGSKHVANLIVINEYIMQVMRLDGLHNYSEQWQEAGLAAEQWYEVGWNAEQGRTVTRGWVGCTTILNTMVWGWTGCRTRLKSNKRLGWLHNHSEHSGMRLDGMQNKVEQWQEAGLAAQPYWTQWYETGWNAEQGWTVTGGWVSCATILNTMVWGWMECRARLNSVKWLG